MITLIPNEDDAKTMNCFRIISLLNGSFKIFTKVLTNRFAEIMDRLISYEQPAFIKVIFLLESVVCAYEIIHAIQPRKSQGLVFKIHYTKAYDSQFRYLYMIFRTEGIWSQNRIIH